MAKIQRGIPYHEAGHAVACFLLGKEFRSIEIASDGGQVLHYPSRLRQDRSHGIHRLDQVPRVIEIFLLPSMAGDIAQKKASPHSVRSGHAQSDRNSQANWLFNIPAWREYVAYCNARLRIAFDDPITWAGVKGLARALMKRKKLSYLEARKAYTDASNKELQRRRRQKSHN